LVFQTQKIMNRKIVAIDFETANEMMSNACSAALQSLLQNS
jgi:hypothetical protein